MEWGVSVGLPREEWEGVRCGVRAGEANGEKTGVASRGGVLWCEWSSRSSTIDSAGCTTWWYRANERCGMRDCKAEAEVVELAVAARRGRTALAAVVDEEADEESVDEKSCEKASLRARLLMNCLGV